MVQNKFICHSIICILAAWSSFIINVKFCDCLRIIFQKSQINYLKSYKSGPNVLFSIKKCDSHLLLWGCFWTIVFKKCCSKIIILDSRFNLIEACCSFYEAPCTSTHISSDHFDEDNHDNDDDNDDEDDEE